MIEPKQEMDPSAARLADRPSVDRRTRLAAYLKPQLRSLGDLRSVTLGRSIGNIESGQANTFRR